MVQPAGRATTPKGGAARLAGPRKEGTQMFVCPECDTRFVGGQCPVCALRAAPEPAPKKVRERRAPEGEKKKDQQPPPASDNR